jgi:hypothetical protein
MSPYEDVAEHLNTLVPMFGLEACSADVLCAYRIIFEGSLRRSPRTAWTRPSRLNHDGTPIQFSLVLGLDAAGLQFLGEVGESDLSETERISVSRRSMSSLSALLGVEKQLEMLSGLIDASCRVNPLEFNPDHGGTFWIGAGFSPKGNSALKIYINGKRGTERESWSRLGEFARYFGASRSWEETKKLLDEKMKPLGMAITLKKGSVPKGRLYLGGYGNRASYYEDLLEHCEGGSVAGEFSQFAACMLGDDLQYPTQSAVFSVAAADGELVDPKMEFCAHCLFRTDQQAFEACSRWLQFRKIDPDPYSRLLNLFSGPIDQRSTNVHVYLGLGWRQQREHTTIYLKPDLRRREADATQVHQ